MCSRRFVLTFGLILAAPIAARGQHRGKSAAVIAPAEPEHLDLDMYSRIRDEGFNHSHVMECAGALFDDIGPRLTGSPAMARANEWTRSQLAAMGLSDAHLQSWGEFGMAWTQQNASLALVKPSASILLAQATPWSPATPGPVTADVIMVSGLNSEADFAQWKGKLKGKVILYGEAPENPSVDPDNVPTMELYKPGSPPVLPYSLLKPDRLANSSYGPIESIFTHKTFLEKAAHFFAAEGAVALLEPGGSGGTLHDDSNYSMGWFVYLPDHKQPIPEEVISDEAYDRMGRLLDQHVPTSVTIDVNTRFGDEHTKGYNTIAEISGIDPGLKDQVVMVGGHLDSWIAGTGATDNGAGAIVAMEAIRILSTLHIQPRRSIRIALWSGEEQGSLGSLGYVQRHFATLHTSDSKGDANLPQAMRPTSAPPTLKPEAVGLDAYFNLDSGSGRITGVGTQGNQGAAKNKQQQPQRPLRGCDPLARARGTLIFPAALVQTRELPPCTCYPQLSCRSTSDDFFTEAIWSPQAHGQFDQEHGSQRVSAKVPRLQRSELAQLETATRSVDVAMYSFTDRELAEELAALARKGVRVRVYRDREQFQQEGQGSVTTTSILIAAGIEVRIKGARDLMHLKSYAIDGRMLRTGSANWSPTGLKRQDNDVRYEASPGAVERFERKFGEMWGRVENATVAIAGE